VPTSIVNADALLAIDVGAANTRAFFFDAVEGVYRFVAVGEAVSTYAPPVNDVSEGVHQAIHRLEQISGRQFIRPVDEILIMPTTADNNGVDKVAATISAAAPLKIVSFGLLEEASLESARNLAGTTYGRLVDSISMNDRRHLSGNIDDLMRLAPDLIVVAGGTDGGASKSVFKLLDPLGLACLLQPLNQRPHILYVGNQDIAPEIQSTFAAYTTVHTAPNIRPALEQEQLGPAEGRLREIFRRIHTKRDTGINQLDVWSEGRLLPAAAGFSRVVQFLDQIFEPTKGVLGIDVGAATTNLAVSFPGHGLRQRIYSPFGLGAPAGNLLASGKLAEVMRWLSVSISETDVRDYLLHKGLYPNSLPVTAEELNLEQALAREIIRAAVKGLRPSFPKGLVGSGPGLLPWFEPIVAAGSVLTNAPTRGQSLLMLLDGLEPTGISTVALDHKNMLAPLGALAEINPLLTVQVLESGALHSLGTVISPVGSARPGTPILRVRLSGSEGEEKTLDIKAGMLAAIPLPAGQTANLHLQPLHRFDVGMGGAGRGGKLKVVGGSLGVVIDARGRPLRLSFDPERRRDQNKKWLAALGN